MSDRPEIVCVCGSARFVEELRRVTFSLTLGGAIVLAPAEADGPVTEEHKVRLDALHRREIDLSDRVVVVSPGGYVGESVGREIAYARSVGKLVSFTEPASTTGASADA